MRDSRHRSSSLARRTQGRIVAAYVVVELARRLRSELGGHAAASHAGRTLRKILAEHDAVVLPSSVSADDDDAFPYTTIQVPDMERANSLATALRAVDGVESAYAKPGEELP